jgi:hypothetical protein
LRTSLCVRGRSEKAVHTPRLFGRLSLCFFAVGVSNGRCISVSSRGFPLAFHCVTPASRRDSMFRNRLKVKPCGSRTCKPNSVCRKVPAGRSFLWATHRCEALATYPEVWRTEPARIPTEAGNSPPIWSCSVWGLPCPLHCCRGGALLPHLFTLTWMSPSGRYVFCGTFRRPGLNPASRTLSGTLLCGVRTFLPRCRERPSDPAANLPIICECNQRAGFFVSGGEDTGLLCAC